MARYIFYDEGLRPGQKEAIESVFAKRDPLVVMPTGPGETAVYQVEAQVLEYR